MVEPSCGAQIVRTGDRTVVTHHGRASTNDGYRVMEKMVERVLGLAAKESRRLFSSTQVWAERKAGSSLSVY